jgi:integrase
MRVHIRRKAKSVRPRYAWNNPGTVIDRSGYVVSTKQECWRLNEVTRPVIVNWNGIESAADIKDSMKAYLTHVIQSNAPQTTQGTFKYLKQFISLAKPLRSVKALTYPVLEGVLAKLRTCGAEENFRAVQRWYRWAVAQDLPGFCEDTLMRLDQIKISSRLVGQAVMSRDPAKGPLNEQEHWLVRQALKAEKGTLIERVCVMLLLELGARACQLLLLKEHHVAIYRAASGETFHALDVPRRKQRTAAGFETKRRRISGELAGALEQLIENNHKQHGNRGPNMPLLCTSRHTYFRKVPDPLKKEYDLHLSGVGFDRQVRQFAVAADIVSPRTQKILGLSALRFRHTFGTRLAEQGTPAKLIAEMLDHSQMSSVLVYIKSTSSLVERLDHVLGSDERFTAVIHRFLGTVRPRIATEVPGSIIPGATPTLKTLGGIGVCGADFLCHLYPPLSCYACPKFIAWTDGPHRKMLEELQLHIQGLSQRGGNPSDRIPKQLAGVIEAIQELLVRLETQRGKTDDPKQ